MNELILFCVSSMNVQYDTVDGNYVPQIIWTFKMAFASRADILSFEIIQVSIAVGNLPVIIFVTAIADDSMTCFTVVVTQLFQ